VPYELHVRGEADFEDGTVKIHFGNSGKSAAVFQVRSGNSQNGPRTYTVGREVHVSDTWTFGGEGKTEYDLSVYGPNGFLRAFKGSVAGRHDADLAITSSYHDEPGITLDIHNRSASTSRVRIFDGYTKRAVSHSVEPGRSLTWHWSLEDSFGWYDLTIEVESDATFLRRIAGHVETGRDSVSDPAIGG
jgi:phospholipase C